MDENQKEIFERITAIEQEQKSVRRRLDGVEKIVASVQEIAVEIKHMREDMNSLNGKVDEIEKRPAKRWDAVIAAILGALGGGIGAMIISLMMNG